MATGPEHFKEAERLLGVADEFAHRKDAIAEAQVHATLALVAATLDSSGTRPIIRGIEWRSALTGKTIEEVLIDIDAQQSSRGHSVADKVQVGEGENTLMVN